MPLMTFGYLKQAVLGSRVTGVDLTIKVMVDVSYHPAVSVVSAGVTIVAVHFAGTDVNSHVGMIVFQECPSGKGAESACSKRLPGVSGKAGKVYAVEAE